MTTKQTNPKDISDTTARFRAEADDASTILGLKTAIRTFIAKHRIDEATYKDRATALLNAHEKRNKRATEIDPSAHCYEEMLWNRLHPIRDKLAQLETQPPSIKRFKRILEVLTTEMLAEAINPRGEFISSDVLLKGFKLLSVTPKKLPTNDTAVDKIYFSKKECDECVKSHARFIAAVREAGRAFAFCLPKIKKYKKARDEAAEPHRDSKDCLFNQLFSRVSPGKYRYTGRHYRYLSANPHGIGTVKTPNSKSTTDCWEKIPEYFTVLAWAEGNSHGSKHKYKNLIESFLDETAKEACSGLLLKSYHLVKQQREALHLQRKSATPNEAEKLDNQIALLDAITGKLSIQLLDWGINPDITDIVDPEAATDISTSCTAEQNNRKPNESSVAKETEDAQKKTYANPIANEIINDPGCELFNDIEGMRLTGESVVSICEDFSRGHLQEKEFSEVSCAPSLYPYWAMAEGAREIKEIWKLTPFYLGKTDSLPERTKLLSKYLDWNCNYSFWQAIDKFYRSALQGDIKYNDSDIMMIHYLGTVYGKSIKLINSLHGRWLEFDLNKLGMQKLLLRHTGRVKTRSTLLFFHP